MRDWRWLATGAAFWLALSGGCSDDGGGAESDTGDVREPPDEEDSGGPSGPRWRTSVVESGGWGRHVDLEVSEDGTVALSYFSTNGVEDGECTELMDSPPRVRFPIHFARRRSGDWSIETVDEPVYLGDPEGLDFEWNPEGRPTVAVTVGEPLPDFGFCGANDAGFYTRASGSNWSLETVVSSSDEAAIDEEGAEFGEVVGLWPALAYDESGDGALVYKDVHAGGRQSDDFRIASLEVALEQGGAWRAKSLDPYRGAGERTRLLFDEEGRPVVVYVIERESRVDDQLGVWVARSEEGGENWVRTRLFSGATASRPAAAVDPETGELNVLFYNSERGFPELAVLEDAEKFADLQEGWRFREQGIGDSRFDSGYNPSIAFDAEGNLHAVFYRCTVATGGLGECNPREDALVHARRTGEFWEREVIDASDQNFCGMDPALGFDGEGRPVVAYQCNRRSEGEAGETVDRVVKFAIEK